MSKKWFLGLIILMTLLMASFARMETPGFSVAGKIIFYKKGDLYIKVVNETEFNEGKDSVYLDKIRMGTEEIGKKQVSFKFDGIPQGIYGILCFQDVNGNGKLDKGEPWGVYRNVRHALRGPKFEEIAFEVNRNITDIQLEVK